MVMQVRSNKGRQTRVTAQLASRSKAAALVTATVAIGALAMVGVVVDMVAPRVGRTTRRFAERRRFARLRAREFVRDDVPPPPIR